MTDAPAPIRVLVVDDHDIVRRGLVGYLGTEPDLEVVGAGANGDAALDLLGRLDGEGRRPHVVVMDLQMEPIDGVEATRRIRSRYSDVAVVALTSFSEASRVQAALAAGASGYLLKTADAADVAEAVRAVSRGEPRLGPEAVRGLISELRAPPRADEALPLTPREREVLQLLALGRPNKTIASELGITERTARTHVSNILHRLGFSSRTEAAVWAIEQGLAGSTSPGRGPDAASG